MKHDDMLDSMLYASHCKIALPSMLEMAGRFCKPVDVADVLKERFGDVNPLDCAKETQIELRPDGREEFTIRGTMPDATMKMSANFQKCMHAAIAGIRCPTKIPQVEEVFFNGRSTTIKWTDGTKTTVSAQEGVEFDEYAGICACFAKKAWGSSRAVKNLLKSDKVHRQKGKRKKAKKGGDTDGQSSDS